MARARSKDLDIVLKKAAERGHDGMPSATHTMGHNVHQPAPYLATLSRMNAHSEGAAPPCEGNKES